MLFLAMENGYPMHKENKQISELIEVCMEETFSQSIHPKPVS